jgi:predicted short-subunit dehydrogenase-like oxidoreductase (DUF2520 family)
MNNTYGVIGCGKVGTVIAKKLALTGKLAWIAAHSEASYRRAKELFADSNIQIYSSIAQIVSPAGALLLAVSDTAYPQVAESLAAHFGERLNGCHAIHFSGSIPVEVLNPLKSHGAFISAAHPYQTFNGTGENILDSIPFGTVSNEDSATVAQFIDDVGGIQVPLDTLSTVQKTLYHITAVAISNFATTAMSLARSVADAAGIDAKVFFKRLAETTLQNNLDDIGNPTIPLTGPVARGDSEMILRHLSALSAYPEMQKAYIHFTAATCELALSYGKISAEQYEALMSMLNF